jgi:hypothetical protein
MHILVNTTINQNDNQNLFLGVPLSFHVKNYYICPVPPDFVAIRDSTELSSLSFSVHLRQCTSNKEK